MKKVKNPDTKLGFGRLVLWQTSSVSVAIATLVLGFVSIYCTDTLGLEPVIVGAVFAASKVVDSITDLLVGFIIDRTNTRWGKGRPYEIFMVALWLCTWLLFSCPASLSNVMKYIWVFFMYIFMNAVCVTFLNGNNVVYMVRAFKTREQQTKLTAYGSFFTMGAGFAFNIFFPSLMAKMATSPAGWSRLIGMFALPLTIIGVLRMLFIPERYNNEADTAQEKLQLRDIVTLFKSNPSFDLLTVVRFLQNIAAGLGTGVYYFTWIIGNVGLMGVTAVFSVIGLPLAFAMPAMRKHLGMKKMSVYGFVVALVGYVMMFFAGSNLVLVVVSGLLSSVAVVPFTMMFNMFIVDCADFNEMNNHPRMEGTLGSVTGFASKVGSAVGGLVTGAVLSLSGYVGTAAEQTSAAILGIRLSASLVPAILFLVMILLMNRYQVDDRLKEWRAQRAAQQAKE